MYVAVVGPGETAQPEDVENARTIGRLLAERGAVVLTGGLGGVMAAAHEGAANAGGISLALLPGDDREDAAAGATIALATGLGELRNALLVRAVDAVIAVGGSWGTLSEVALAMRAGVPVVCLGGWTIRTATDESLALTRASSAREAVEIALGGRMDA